MRPLQRPPLDSRRESAFPFLDLLSPSWNPEQTPLESWALGLQPWILRPASTVEA